MLPKIIDFSLSNRPLVLFISLALMLAGFFSLVRLPMDAVPDITNVQVQINSAVSALPPEEVEKLVTLPLERELTGIPGCREVRSISKFGLSQVNLIFEDGTDVYRARQTVGEKLVQAIEGLPPGIVPRMAPVSTGLGEIFYYTFDFEPGHSNAGMERRRQLMELKTLHDKWVKPALRTVQGVAEVNLSGGYDRQILLRLDPSRLRLAGLTTAEVAEKVDGNFDNLGGGSIELGGEQILLRSSGRVASLDELKTIPVKRRGDGTVIRLEDLGEIELGSSERTGSATVNGREALLGSVMMLAGENSRSVAKRVAAATEELSNRLPKGLVIAPLYDRSDLVDRTIRTVGINLFEGAVLVIMVLLAFLGHFRAALLVSLLIPLSFLFAVSGMVGLGFSGNLMSLGAVDFGLIVDGAIVMVENVLRRTGVRQAALGRSLTDEERHLEVSQAAKEVVKPTFFGVLIITLVFIPILSLQGVEGRMFKPMAWTLILALGGSLLFTLFLVPVLASLFLGRGAVKEPKWEHGLRAWYGWILESQILRPRMILAFATALMISAAFVFWRMGGEFVPQLEEGSTALHVIRTTSIGLGSSLKLQERLEKDLLARFPEVRTVFSRIGTSEIATDPMGVNVSDTYLAYAPSAFRTNVDGRRQTKDSLVERINEHLERTQPGQAFLFSQPIEMRFNEILEGTRADVAVKVFGEDYAQMEAAAGEIREILEKVPGAGDVEFDAIGKVTLLEIVPKRPEMLAWGVSSRQINEVVSYGLAGAEVGRFTEGQRLTPALIRFDETIRRDFDRIARLAVKSDEGDPVLLSRVADLVTREEVASISRENGNRRVAILVNLRGGDVETFVRTAESRIRESVLPRYPNLWVEYGGQFKNMRVARDRLAVVVPVALLLIFSLIFMLFGNLRQTLLVASGIPLALTGGVLTLALRGMPFSISAGVGFIAVSGVAVLNGLMLVSFFNQLRQEGRALDSSVREGAILRLRPVLMTALVASLGFLPMAFSGGAGAEVQKPLATVVIGGIFTSTLLTLLILPPLYLRLESGFQRKNPLPLETAPS